MKQFKRTDGTSLHFYEQNGEHFIKQTKKWGRVREAPVIGGPFKTEGDALLAAGTSKAFNFSDFRQVYPTSKQEDKRG